MKSARKSSGFTLIELMVAISILAILTVSGVVVFRNINDQAKMAKVHADMKAILNNIELARVRDKVVLGRVTYNAIGATHNFYSEVNCRLPNYTNDPICIEDMRKAYAKITTAELPLDPWGGIYTFDENEHEKDMQMCCVGGGFNTVQDFMSSGGPDHILDYGTGNDSIHVAIPPMYCSYDTGVVHATCGCVPGSTCVLP